jgi:hypothetical protein
MKPVIYQIVVRLAPLQYLSGSGPVLLLNGQEVGEPGAQAEGYQLADGRTTVFDYWAMPEFVKWVNGGRYDGGGLSKAQLALRQFYAWVMPGSIGAGRRLLGAEVLQPPGAWTRAR